MQYYDIEGYKKIREGIERYKNIVEAHAIWSWFFGKCICECSQR